MKKLICGVLICVVFISLTYRGIENSFEKFGDELSDFISDIDIRDYGSETEALKERNLDSSFKAFNSIINKDAFSYSLEQELCNVYEDVSIHIAEEYKVMEDNGRERTQYFYRDYQLQLNDITRQYNTPWQIYFLFSNEHKSNLLKAEKLSELLKPRYYGLYDDDDTELNIDDISDDTEFQFFKETEQIIKKTEYIIESKPTVIGVDELGKDIIEDVDTVTEVETTSTTIIKTPLPYFTKISTFCYDVEFKYHTRRYEELDEYDYKSAGNYIFKEVNRKCSEPELVGTNIVLNTENIKSIMRMYSISKRDMEELIIYLSHLPANNIPIEFKLAMSEILGTDKVFEKYDLNNYYGFVTSILDIDRRKIVEKAMELLGLDYFWGGKYYKTGKNPDWGKAKYEPYKGITQNYGLDCSGYVDWVFMNSIGERISVVKFDEDKNLSGTALQVKNSVPITKDELLPGDLGFYALSGSNHVGIFIGKDDNGSMLFIHCGGRTWKDENHPYGQVIISKLDEYYNGYKPVRFKYFRRPLLN